MGVNLPFSLNFKDLHHIRSGPWLLCGNFNMVYRVEDKNNGRITAPPRRSAHLVKKTGRRVPAVAAAQNVLMKRLGMVAGEHVESEEFSRYNNLFCDGLSEDQAPMIDELVMDKPPAPLEAEVEEAE
jgi:hypothetical protein